jgi:hypothetical protein
LTGGLWEMIEAKKKFGEKLGMLRNWVSKWDNLRKAGFRNGQHEKVGYRREFLNWLRSLRSLCGRGRSFG